MEQDILIKLNAINRVIIQFRGLYSQWTSEHGLTYHELLVLYTIREYGYCSQKMICDSYLLPKQTIHHVFSVMLQKEFLQPDPLHSKGREKAFVLTEKGELYTRPFLQALNSVESRAVELMGTDDLQVLTQLLMKYSEALNCAMSEDIV